MNASSMALPITSVNLTGSLTSVKQNPSDIFPYVSLRGKAKGYPVDFQKMFAMIV